MHLASRILEHGINRTNRLFDIAGFEDRVFAEIEDLHTSKEAAGGSQCASKCTLEFATGRTPRRFCLSLNATKRAS